MSNYLISMPANPFSMPRQFKAVANGKIWIGQPDTDPSNTANQIPVYIVNENGTEVQVAQPILINAGGFPVLNGQIRKFVTVQNYSMLIQDAYGAQQFYFEDVAKYDPDQLRKQLEDPDGAEKYPELQISRWRDAGDVRGWGALTDGVTVCDAYFQAAEADRDIIYVPDGEFLLSSPFVLAATKFYYGPGVLKFQDAYWLRAGGSAGGTATQERFTLFWTYDSQDDVYCEVDGVAQTLTWLNTTTFYVPPPPSGTLVKYGVRGGKQRLGLIPEAIKSYSAFGQVPNSWTPTIDLDTGVSRSYNNCLWGTRSGMSLTTGSNNTAIGARALLSNTVAGNLTAVGFQALYRCTGQGNTAVGSVAGEWLETGEFNSLFGLSAGSHIRSGSYNVALGYQAMGANHDGNNSVAIGYRAFGNTGFESTVQSSVAVGAFAGDFCRGGSNVFLGYRAGNGALTGSEASNLVAIGFMSLRNHTRGDSNIAIGSAALYNKTSGENNVAIGFNAAYSLTVSSQTTALGDYALEQCSASASVGVGYQAGRYNTTGVITAIGTNCLSSNTTGTDNTAVGLSALASNTTGSGNAALGNAAGQSLSTGLYNTYVGSRAGRLNVSTSNNVAVGRDALYNHTTGGSCTAIGVDALKTGQNGNAMVNVTNSTGIGFGASVSGDNQVQIGNSLTTTYVYGTVQNRSDIRDKIKDDDAPVLGLDFILGLNPIQGRWNMRDDYWTHTETEDGTITSTFDQAGYEAQTKKRTRLHQWFAAQDVLALLEKLGIDPDTFGALQHHAVNGGADVYSLGYDEFIPPVVSAVQACWKRMDELEARLAKLEKLLPENNH
ncbi:tail fiber domain-containing protein [Escherichia coli]|nr:tail fiber domain-containing protein [Escherichia coli]